MDLNQVLQELKKESGFKDSVGMILIHNGVVRGISRSGKKVKKLKILKVDYSLIDEIRKKYESYPGIYKILVHAREGEFSPGDDLLWIVVAGDVRENVKKALSEILDEIKSNAVKKQEILEE